MELWLDEELELEEGRALKVRVTRVLESFRTEYQRLDIVETQSYGRMMLLDGVIMFTDRDEFCYHEMIAHVPLMSHAEPKRVLIVGGGDGGAAREVLKHRSVEEVIICDIDPMVTEMSKKYFPKVSCSFSDSRARPIHTDGAVYVREHAKEFDVVITDSTDPIGPATVLFQKGFYASLKECLRPGGIAVTQAESFQYHEETISRLYSFIPDVFKVYGYYWTSIPTYPSGIIGFAFLSDAVNPYSCPLDPARVPADLKYYSLEMHRASFVLPPFAKKFITTTAG